MVFIAALHGGSRWMSSRAAHRSRSPDRRASCYGLKLPDLGLPNCSRSFEYFRSSLVRALGHAESQRGDGDSAAIERAHGVDEALTFMSYRSSAGNHNLRRSVPRYRWRGARACSLSCRREILAPLLHHEGRESMGVRRLVGNRDDHGDVSVVAIGDEGLVAVEHPFVASSNGIAPSHRQHPNLSPARSVPMRPGIRRWQVSEGTSVSAPIAGDVDVVGAQRGMGRYP